MKRVSVLLVALAVTQAHAQDFIPYLQIEIDSQRYGRELRDNLERAHPWLKDDAKRSQLMRKAPATIPQGSVETSFTYRSTPVTQRTAIQQYLERLGKTDPKVAEKARAEFGRNDVTAIYSGIVAPFGYRPDDAAAGLAAYTLLGWLIATGAPDPSSQQAVAVRGQIAESLATNPRLKDPARLASLAEELKISFVTLHAGWQSARRDGTLPAYSDGVAGLFARNGGPDLRSFALTDTGFAKRSAH